MSNIELTKKRVRVEMALGECVDDFRLESEIEFPVEVRKIRDICADVSNVIAKPETGKILVQGKLVKKITWVAACNGVYEGVSYEAGGIYDLLVEESFSHYVMLADVTPSAHAMAEVRIKDLEVAEKSMGGHDLLDIWKQCVELQVYVKAGVILDADIVTDVYFPGMALEVIKETCGIESIVGECHQEVHLMADIEFHCPVARIVSVQTRLQDLKSEALTDKVRVSGVLHKRIYYAELHTKRMYETSVEEPWNELLDLPGARPGLQVNLEAMVTYCEVVIKPENNEEARQRAIIKVNVKVVEDLVLNYVKDVVGSNCHVLKGTLWCNDLIGYGCTEVVIKKEVCFDQPVKKIMSKSATVKFDRKATHVTYGEVCIVGELDKNICFMDMCEDTVWEKCVYEPFEAKIEIPGAEEGMIVKLASEVKQIDLAPPEYPRDCCYDTSFLASLHPWCQTAVVEIQAKVFAPREMQVVTDVVCAPAPPTPVPTPCPTSTPCPPTPCPPSPRPTKEPGGCEPGYPGQPSMRFYIIQQGDTIYKLANKYGTTVEAIMAANPGIDPYNLQIGSIIKIPCGVPGAKG